MGKLEGLACNYEEVAKEMKEQTSPKLEASQQEQILKTEMEKCKLVSELSGENVSVQKSPTRKVVIEPTYNPNAIKEITPNKKTEEQSNIQPIMPDGSRADFTKKTIKEEKPAGRIGMPNLYDTQGDKSRKIPNLYNSEANKSK